ncbi:MAG: glycoside hydrolase family 19 protein [Sphingobacteriales bacterium]|jgi:predicted chitinase
MNTTTLFASLHQLSTTLTQQQVDSVNAILDECTKHAINDIHQLAYILATCYHESRFKPISEIGFGKGHSYGIPDPITHQTYYGRGFVQLTWKGNYESFGKILGIDLVDHPELALQTDYAAAILVIGMKLGNFTGKSLNNYFTGTTNDPVNARRIINGTDCAQLIAGYYNHILEGLTA